MSSTPISPLRRAWLRWKALRLPWRKKFLVGLDLSGATFWEFADKLSPDPTRMRRIVEYPRNPKQKMYYSDVTAQISPAWHQWLRHTRLDPPSLTEQALDVQRQERLKVLVARADAKWAAGRRRVADAVPLGGRAGLLAGSVSGEKMGDGDKLVEVEGERQGRKGEGGRERELLSGGDEEGDQREGVGRNNVKSADGKKHSFASGELKDIKEKKEDPWQKARGGPGEEWQPQAWNPNAMAARR